MSDLGQLLKKARTQKGYTLDELQDITKIRKRYLEAIEEGNYKVLPGNFYVRAFIKSYAEAIGLDPDEVLKLHKTDIPVVHHEPVVETVPRRRTKPVRNTDKLSRWASALLVVAFPILIVAVFYYFYWNNMEQKQIPEDPLPITDMRANPEADNSVPSSEPDPAVEPIVDPEPERPDPVISLVKSEQGVDYYALSNTDQIKVVVEVIGDRCWMAVRKDHAGGEFVEQNLTLLNGETKEWTFDGGAFFHFGRVNAIKVKVNDLEINVGDTANPRRVQIDLAQAAEAAM